MLPLPEAPAVPEVPELPGFVRLYAPLCTSAPVAALLGAPGAVVGVGATAAATSPAAAIANQSFRCITFSRFVSGKLQIRCGPVLPVAAAVPL